MTRIEWQDERKEWLRMELQLGWIKQERIGRRLMELDYWMERNNSYELICGRIMTILIAIHYLYHLILAFVVSWIGRRNGRKWNRSLVVTILMHSSGLERFENCFVCNGWSPCSNKQESLQEKEIDERRKENKDEEAYAIQIGETTGIQHF